MDLALWVAIVGAIAALAAAALPKIIEVNQERRKEARLRLVTVDRIQSPAHPDVLQVLKLCERRMPAAERDDLDDMVRWLGEVEEESRRGVCKLDDFFLVARAGEDLAGFAYIQVYPSTSLAFFSYLVVDEGIPEAKYCEVSTKLLQRAKKLIARSCNCRAIVFEVDEPSVLAKSKTKRASARIRLFKALARMTGCPLKSVAVTYLQPRLSLGESDHQEIPMRLMYAQLDTRQELRRLHKRDVADILDFLAGCVYGDHFENRPDLDKSFREYLNHWKEDLLRTVPEVVELK